MVEEKGYTFLYTVGELKEYIKNLDDNMKLGSSDADVGGYDVCNHSFINPVIGTERLYLGHEECVAYEDDRGIYEKHFNTGSVVSKWKVLDDYAAYRELNGARVAFIEKTPRVKHPITNEWIEGPKGAGGGNPEKDETYGFYKPSREWCDKKLVELGYSIPKG